MTFYQDMQNVASDILKEFSQGVVKYIEVTPGVGPADDPGDPDETEYDLDAAVRGVKFKYVDKSLIVSTDLQLTMAIRSDVTPAMNGFVSVDGTRYKIVSIKPIPAAGIPVANVIIFRK